MSRKWKARALEAEAALAAVKPSGVRTSSIVAYPAPNVPMPTFAIQAPPPRVLPDGAPTMAQDESFGSAIQWGNTGLQANNYINEGLTWMGYPWLAQLTQRAEYRRGPAVIAQEMTRKGWKIGTKGSDGAGDKAKKISEITDDMEKFHIVDRFREAIEVDNFFGRSQLFIDVGQSNLTLPLVIGPKTIKRGSLRGFKLVEPVWTYPADYNSDDPLAPDFYNPRAWYVMGQKIAASRMLTFIGQPVPDMLKPQYAFGGMSMTQMAMPYVNNWIRTRQSVSDLIHSFNVPVLSTNLASTLEEDGTGTSLFGRVDLFNRLRDNRGTMVLDKDTETFGNVTTPLSTLDHLQAQALEQVCVVNGIPLVIWTGVTPSGLNASAEGEIRVFYDSINAMQERRFNAPLTKVLQILQLNRYGEIDPDIIFTFNPLWEMSEKERAEIRRMDAETAGIYMDHGVLDNGEERGRLVAEEGGVYQALDLSYVPEVPSDPMLGDEPETEQTDEVDGRPIE